MKRTLHLAIALGMAFIFTLSTQAQTHEFVTVSDGERVENTVRFRVQSRHEWPDYVKRDSVKFSYVTEADPGTVQVPDQFGFLVREPGGGEKYFALEGDLATCNNWQAVRNQNWPAINEHIVEYECQQSGSCQEVGRGLEPGTVLLSMNDVSAANLPPKPALKAIPKTEGVYLKRGDSVTISVPLCSAYDDISFSLYVSSIWARGNASITSRGRYTGASFTDSNPGTSSTDSNPGTGLERSSVEAPSNLTATIHERGILLEWTPPSDVTGIKHYAYALNKNPGSIYSTSFDNAVPGGSIATSHLHQCSGGTRYDFRIRSVTDLEDTNASNVASATCPLTVVSAESEEVPEVLSLMQNYPNPFNPMTRITYSVPQAGHVRIKLYDMYGQQVGDFSTGTDVPGCTLSCSTVPICPPVRISIV